MPAGNVTITAQWTINQYTITFEANGGSAVAAITQDYNTAYRSVQRPTKTGYTFNGWSQAVPATMPAGSVTLTAQWTINQYTITFDANGEIGGRRDHARLQHRYHRAIQSDENGLYV
ncbi:MAG: InlB B-repeat-containing protein [Desulfobacterales bacterium]|nr:InlB B-repeat-containing protein [Desulfobacterales bacterium]